MRNRTGRTAQDKTCQKSMEGETENEQHVVLECPAYRVERNRMLRKANMGKGGGGGGGGGGFGWAKRRGSS